MFQIPLVIILAGCNRISLDSNQLWNICYKIIGNLIKAFFYHYSADRTHCSVYQRYHMWAKRGHAHISIWRRITDGATYLIKNNSFCICNSMCSNTQIERRVCLRVVIAATGRTCGPCLKIQTRSAGCLPNFS